MSVHTLRETDVTAKNVRADRLQPGDVLLQPTDKGTVQVSTVLQATPSRLTKCLTVVTLTYADDITCPRDKTFTVLRSF